MSKSSMLTIPFVIPLYHGMKTKLASHADNANLLSQLQLAAAAGLTKLNKYFDLAWENHYNVIGTGQCSRS